MKSLISRSQSDSDTNLYDLRLKQSISFVAGVYRLESNIDLVLTHYRKFSEINDIEIVWCLNGPAVADYDAIKYKLENSGLTYKLTSSEQGLGNAVRACLELPSKDVVVFTGADLPFVFSDLRACLGLTDAEFILGEKRVKDFWNFSNMGRNFARSISGFAHYLLFRCHDPNGSQIMSNQVWKMLVSRSKEVEFSIGIELYSLALINGVAVSRVNVQPAPWLTFEGSTVNLLETSRNQFLTLIKLKFKSFL
jgi:hypothetical protein